MKKSTTAKAFVMSVLALVLCLSMLVGTTFAWFTDSVTSGVNKIVAGNLDVKVEYAELKDDGSFNAWKTVSSETPLFDQNALWEPGHTEVVYLKISNEGTLSLNYKLAVTVAHEHQGTRYNKEAKRSEFFKLSDYLKFGAVTDWDGTTFYSRTAAQEAIGEAGKLKDYSTTGSIKASEKETNIQYIALVVYMPEEIGNEANHESGSDHYIPWIELGINLEATQMVDENDSFGNDYDKDAFQNDTESSAFVDLTKSEFSVSTEADLLKLADLVFNGQTFEGKKITIDKDITLAQDKWKPIGTETMPFKGTFDGGNHTISGLKITEDANGLAGFFGRLVGATVKNLKVAGNITLNATDATEYISIGGICASGENVIFENCENQVAVDASAITSTSEENLAPSIYIGGILGGIFGRETGLTATFTNCKNVADLTAADTNELDDTVVGGITSAIYMQKVIDTGCSNTGRLTGMVTNDLYTKP